MFVKLPLSVSGEERWTAVNSDNVVSVEEINDRRCQLHLNDNTSFTVRMPLDEAVAVLNGTKKRPPPAVPFPFSAEVFGGGGDAP